MNHASYALPSLNHREIICVGAPYPRCSIGSGQLTPTTSNGSRVRSLVVHKDTQALRSLNHQADFSRSWWFPVPPEISA